MNISVSLTALRSYSLEVEVTGTGHRIAGLGGALGLAGIYASHDVINAAIAAVACIAGANAPDWLEVPYGNGRRLITHRTVTHWVPAWIVGLIIGLLLVDPFFGALVVGFVVGGLIHLSGDAITPAGVPWLHPLQRVRLSRVSSGGFSEITWVAAIWLFALLISPVVPTVSDLQKWMM